MRGLKLGLFLVIFGLMFLILGISSMFLYKVNPLVFYIICCIGGAMFGMGFGILKNE